MSHHYKVRPKDHAIEQADLRLRRAHQAKLDNPRVTGKQLRELQKEERDSHTEHLAAHALDDYFVCDRCNKEFELSKLVLIVFLRVIRQGQWHFDDEKEKYIRLCIGCDKRLKLIRYPENEE